MKSVLRSLVVVVALVLGACAKDSKGGSENTQVAVVPEANTCPAGQIPTEHGCLPQGNCNANHGLYYNQCVPMLNYAPNGQYPQGYPPGYPNGYSYGYRNGGSYNYNYYRHRSNQGIGGYYGNPYSQPYGAGFSAGAGFYFRY